MNPVVQPATSDPAPSRPLPQQAEGDAQDAGAGADVDSASARAWRLQRRCALSPRQFAAALGCVAALALVLAAFFFLLGAPLISAFLAAQLLIVAAAFAHHAVHAADGERLWLQGDRLQLEGRQGLRQHAESFALSSLRVAPAGGGLIELRAPDRRLEVGRHAQAGQRRQVLLELQRCAASGWLRRSGQAGIGVEQT